MTHSVVISSIEFLTKILQRLRGGTLKVVFAILSNNLILKELIGQKKFPKATALLSAIYMTLQPAFFHNPMLLFRERPMPNLAEHFEFSFLLNNCFSL